MIIAAQPSYFFGIVTMAELPLGFTIRSNIAIKRHSEFIVALYCVHIHLYTYYYLSFVHRYIYT